MISMSYEKVKDKANELEAPLIWALKKRRGYLNDVITQNEKSIMGSIKKLAGSDELYRGLLNRRIADDSKMIKDAGFELRRLDPTWKPRKNGLTDEMIERAREYPIKALLPNPVKRNMTSCCFHNDKHPSMYINDSNYAYCFSCNKGWNPIDFIMSIKGYDFKETVKYLSEII